MVKNVYKLISIVLVMGLILSLLAACGQGAVETSETTKAQQASQSTSASSEEIKAGAFTKYDPPIKLSIVRPVDEKVKFKDGDDINNNVWVKALKEQLGIEITHEWTAPNAEQYAQKLNLAITSGDIPDLITFEQLSTYSSIFKQLRDSDMLEDLAPYFDQYKTEMLEQHLMAQGDGPLKALSVDGKLYALPQISTASDISQFLYIRNDWLKKLNREAPKSIEELIDLAKAFVNEDPDGNNKKDTYALAVNSTLFAGGYAGIQGFCNAFNAYPDIWVRNDKGEVVYGGIQPQMKEALVALSDLYKAGAIDPEFGVKPAAKVAETIAQGRIGINYGQQWNPIFPLTQDVINNEGADWGAYPIVGKGGAVVKSQTEITISKAVGIRKGYKNPEVVYKLFAFYLERGFGTDLQREELFDVKDGIAPFHYSPVIPEPFAKNVQTHERVVKAMELGNDSPMRPHDISALTSSLAYKDKGDKNFFGHFRVFAAGGSQSIAKKYIEEGLLQYNVLIGLPAPKYIEVGSSLSDMQAEAFMKIILGDEDISYFDTFVGNWLKLGGEQVTKEMNEMYK